MKRIFVRLVLAGLVLTACSPIQGAVNGLQQLPDEGRLLVLMLITAGVTWLLLKASVVFKQDLSGYAAPLAAAIAPIIVTLIEAGLKLIPPIFDNLVLSIIHLVVLAVGSIGAFFVFKRKVPSLR